MDYNHITNFFSKFKDLLFKQEESNKIIVNIITKHISYPIESNIIKTKGSIIYIQGSPMLRSEVLIHKSGILSDLANLLPESHFMDIR
jgi:hypothetical protein